MNQKDIIIIILKRLRLFYFEPSIFKIANFWKYNLEFVDDQTPTQRDSYRGYNLTALTMFTKLSRALLTTKRKNKNSITFIIRFFQILRIVCSNQINVFSLKKLLIIQYNNANDFSCLNMPLSPYEKKSFVFRINANQLLINQKDTGYLGIGIAILKVIKPQKFFFGQLNQTGHGVFMVLNNRVVYNNSYLEHNRISIKIELKEGKKYQLTFDPLKKIIQFADPYSMPIEIDETLDYHVFVHIGNKDGKIELLNEF
ncbi:hypothetical protein pb186bvf_004908 [Paramecium bursaria]